MTIGSPSARFSAQLEEREGALLTGRGGHWTALRVGAPAIRGRRPLDDDVVDESGGADGGGDDEQAVTASANVSGSTAAKYSGVMP